MKVYFSMKNPFLVFYLVLFVGMSSVAQTTQPTTAPYATKFVATTTTKADNYEISYPEDWRFDDSGFMDTQFILHSPLTTIRDKFAENVNYISTDLSTHELDLDQYVDLSIKQISTLITNGKIITNKRLITSDGQPYQLLIYSGDQGFYELKYLQHIYLEDQVAHLITFTAEQDKFNAYFRMAEKIMYSFTRK